MSLWEKLNHISLEEKGIKKEYSSRDIRQMFLSRSTERQAGNDGKTVVIGLILKKKKKKKGAWINQHFLCIFIFSRVFIFAKYGFRAYFACIYFREWRLKENFACIWFCEIDQNSLKFAQICTRQKLVRLRYIIHKPIDFSIDFHIELRLTLRGLIYICNFLKTCKSFWSKSKSLRERYFLKTLSYQK